jgi:hypothetical protein
MPVEGRTVFLADEQRQLRIAGRDRMFSAAFDEVLPVEARISDLTPDR